MRAARLSGRRIVPCCAILALALWAEPARAQIHEVVVGITTTCPYENAIEGSCWSGARTALMELEGIKSVSESANGYTCTARVYLKDKGLPDPDKWALQFKELVGQGYAFRGVEVTVIATVAGDNSGLVLRVPGVERPVALRPLEHKLQWNARKDAPRQLEPDERDAYGQLASKVKDSQGGELKVMVTGPLRKSDTGYTVEVREFFPLTREAVARP
jgi:hypothetical protein